MLLPDADMATAVKVGVATAFLNGGQTCTAWTRMLVHDDHYAEAVELAASIAASYTPGDPLDPATKLDPMVSAAQQERVRGLIRTGVDEGATIATGGWDQLEGLDRGYLVAPTVLMAMPDLNIRRLRSPKLSALRALRRRSAVSVTPTIMLWPNRLSSVQDRGDQEGSPFRVHPAKKVEDIEYATLAWVDWYNNRRLHSVLGYVPPHKFEATY